MYATFVFRDIESFHRIGGTSFTISDGSPGMNDTKKLNIKAVIDFIRGLPTVTKTISLEWELLLWLENYNGKREKRILYYDSNRVGGLLDPEQLASDLLEVEKLLTLHANEGYSDKIFTLVENKTKELNNVF